MQLTDKIKNQIAEFKLTTRYIESDVSKRLVQELEHMVNTGFLGNLEISPSELDICYNSIHLEWKFKEGRNARVKIELYVTGHFPEMQFYLPHPIYSNLDHMNIEVHSSAFFEFIRRFKGYLTNNAD
jgi:hypothetical protein